MVAGIYYAVVLLATAVFQGAHPCRLLPNQPLTQTAVVRIVLTLRRSSAGQGDSPIEEASHKAERALLIRVMIFGVYVFVGFMYVRFPFLSFTDGPNHVYSVWQ